MIPKIIHTTFAEHPKENIHYFWNTVLKHTPDWEHRIYQDPRKPEAWKLTSPYWHLCKTGATRANLVRLEALWLYGGIYLDSDIELIRPIDELTNLSVFAVMESNNILGNAVIGAEPRHPAVKSALDVLISVLQTDYRPPIGPLSLTLAWLNREDVTKLPKHTFYPYSYFEKHRRYEDFSKNKNTFGVHHWNATWN
jgi:mannosyltransferase OCH1-like enzyme